MKSGSRHPRGSWHSRRESGQGCRRRGHTRVIDPVERLECRWVLAVTYHGGPILSHVKVENVYYGGQWNDNTTSVGGLTLAQARQQLDQFAGFITNSPYMNQIAADYGGVGGALA